MFTLLQSTHLINLVQLWLFSSPDTKHKAITRINQEEHKNTTYTHTLALLCLYLFSIVVWFMSYAHSNLNSKAPATTTRQFCHNNWRNAFIHLFHRHSYNMLQCVFPPVSLLFSISTQAIICTASFIASFTPAKLWKNKFFSPNTKESCSCSYSNGDI